VRVYFIEMTRSSDVLYENDVILHIIYIELNILLDLGLGPTYLNNRQSCVVVYWEGSLFGFRFARPLTHESSKCRELGDVRP